MTWSDEMRRRITAPVVWPDELAALFEFVERRRWLHTSSREGLVGGTTPGAGSRVTLRVATAAEARDDVSAYLGVRTDDPRIGGVRPFARIGSDGSQAALWAHDGGQCVVRLGDMFRVIAYDPMDFLRQIAIGYTYLDVNAMASPPDPEPDPESVGPLRTWLWDTFAVETPDCGMDVLPQGSVDFWYDGDPFEAWWESLRAEGGSLD